MYSFYPSYQGGTDFPGGQDNASMLPATDIKDNVSAFPTYTGSTGEFPVLPTETGCTDVFPTSPISTVYPNSFTSDPSFLSYPTYPASVSLCPDCLNTQPVEVLPVQGRYCNEALTRIIQECQATCEYLTTHLKCRCDTRARRNQLIILRDCADICAANTRFVPRGSAFDKQTVFVCGCICESCAKECARFSDRLSQQAAVVCAECAKACFDYVR